MQSEGPKQPGKTRGPLHITKPTWLDVEYLGQWQTPWWVDGEDRGPKLRAGFKATCEINRQEFGVGWQGEMANNGGVVGNRIFITIDVEALLDDV